MSDYPMDIPFGLDDDTACLVVAFANALAQKLYRAQEVYGYSNGWLIHDWENDCRRDFLAHVKKGDPLDVAAYCAFMWRRGWSTARRP